MTVLDSCLSWRTSLLQVFSFFLCLSKIYTWYDICFTPTSRNFILHNLYIKEDEREIKNLNYLLIIFTYQIWSFSFSMFYLVICKLPLRPYNLCIIWILYFSKVLGDWGKKGKKSRKYTYTSSVFCLKYYHCLLIMKLWQPKVF